MSVCIEPLIDDLFHAWEEGVWTYDRATKTNFKMRVWYMYSLHDLQVYAIFCGESKERDELIYYANQWAEES